MHNAAGLGHRSGGALGLDGHTVTAGAGVQAARAAEATATGAIGPATLAIDVENDALGASSANGEGDLAGNVVARRRGDGDVLMGGRGGSGQK